MSFVASKTTEKQCEKIYNFSPFFLLQRNVTHILKKRTKHDFLSFFYFSGMEHHSFSSDNHNNMGNHEVNRPVQLTPSWEAQKHASEDRLNFRTLSVSMDRLDLEMNPPVDR